MIDMDKLDPLDRQLLDSYQHDLPLVENPYAAMAQKLNVDEDDIIQSLKKLQDFGAISRIGAVVAPHKAGWSTLAALKVPMDQFEKIATLVSNFDAVNHNYQREHSYNLWFVVAAHNKQAVKEILTQIEEITGLTPLNLPMEKAYHIDLGFKIKWH